MAKRNAEIVEAESLIYSAAEKLGNVPLIRYFDGELRLRILDAYAIVKKLAADVRKHSNQFEEDE